MHQVQSAEIYLQQWIIRSAHVQVRLRSSRNQVHLDGRSVVAGIQRMNESFKHSDVVSVYLVFSLKRRNELKVDIRRSNDVHLSIKQSTCQMTNPYIIIIIIIR